MRRAVLLLPLLWAAGARGADRLVWADEFDGPAGAPPSASAWTAEEGGHGWGNDELEFYTRRPENAHLDGKGHLVIEARREEFRGRHFTSARLITKGQVAFRSGTVAARIRLPRGRGIWPAFWMLGENIDRAGWPGCGEIDILELLGHEPGKVYGTIHGPGYSGGDGIGAAFSLTGTGSFADDFHVFAIEWSPNRIRWLVDGVPYETRTPADLKGKRWVFDGPFFVILNVAVGGGWPGAPDASTAFPQRMEVDWIRWTEPVSGPGAAAR